MVADLWRYHKFIIMKTHQACILAQSVIVSYSTCTRITWHILARLRWHALFIILLAITHVRKTQLNDLTRLTYLDVTDTVQPVSMRFENFPIATPIWA